MFRGKAKTKMVTFRLSYDEFQDIQLLAEREGFRSFSDLIRIAVQQMLADFSVHPERAIQSSLERMNTRMDELHRDIKELKSSVSGESR